MNRAHRRRAAAVRVAADLRYRQPPHTGAFKEDQTMANEVKTVLNPSCFTLPTGILQETIDIIDEQEDHIVLTVRIPKNLIRDNRALLTALCEIVDRAV